MSILNPELAGRTYTAHDTYIVGREKVREFARAIFADNAIHFDEAAARAAGYPNVVAPATFSTIVTSGVVDQMLADPATGVDTDRVYPVHASEELAITSPLVVGDELVATLTITSVRERGPAAILGTRQEIRTVSGELRITVTSSILITEKESEVAA